MKILALELSTARGSIAWLDEVDLVMREWTNDRKNSGPFFVNLQNIREKFGPPEEIIVGRFLCGRSDCDLGGDWIASYVENATYRISFDLCDGM